MYWVIRHKDSGQIYSCKLVNGYDMEYYGVKNWDDRDAAEAELPSFLKSRGESDPGEWTLYEIEEIPLKMLNVKLNNNPAKRVYIDGQGKTEAKYINS
jgi:hypothetical protein